MLKKILASAFVCGMATAAFAQSMAIVQNSTAVTTGADAASFGRDTTHFTFDLQGNTAGADWTGSEVAVDVVGTGSIWHATDQRLSINSPPADPNESCYVHNLQTPGLTFGAANNANSRMYDTFFTGPGSRFTVDPQFASPGVPSADPAACPANPPIVSTATRLRGLNPAGTEIPLAWFDAVNAPLAGGSAGTLARLTFQVPANAAITGTEPGAGRVLFATIRGRITSAANPNGTNFSFDIYQTPEPSTMALLALGGIAGLLRRR